MLINKLQISNFAGYNASLTLDKETIVCGNGTGQRIIIQSILQLFGQTGNINCILPGQDESRCSAVIVFPENESVPELFHHLNSGKNGNLYCMLESTVCRKGKRITQDFNWLLPHDVKRPVKPSELSEFDILYLSNDLATLKSATRKILSRIFSFADDPDFSAAEFCEQSGLKKFLPILTDSENIAAAADTYARRIIEFETAENRIDLHQNIQILLAKLLEFADKKQLLPWHTLFILDDLPLKSMLFWKENLHTYSAIQALYFSNTSGILRNFPLSQLYRSTTDSATRLVLPDGETEKAYISEVINSFPELINADMIIFTPSASDRVILEKFIQLCEIDFFKRNIAFIPLAGESVQYVWQIAEQFKIPYLTLMALDHQHPGGDWERIAAVLDSGLDIGKPLPAAEGTDDPIDTAILLQTPVDLASEMIWLDWLENNRNTFISAPQNLNWLMFQAFSQEYRELFSKINQDDDSAFFQQLFSRCDPVFIHTKLFGYLSDEKILQRIPEFISRIMDRIKNLLEQIK